MKKLTKILMVGVTMMALALVAIPMGNSSAATDCFNKGKFTYQITGKNTCTVKEFSQKGCNSSSCVIPSTVNCKGKKYKVTAIADNAFCNNDKIKTVKCPNTIKTIGTNAFYDCDSLKSVKIGSKCGNVENNAFGSCNTLRKINCSSQIKTLGTNCFGNATCNIAR